MTADLGKFHFRLVLLGSNGTGKTSILNRFLFKKFETKYKPTVEDLFCKDFDLGSIEIKVDFLDTSGSMQFPAMRRLSITTGSAFLIVYSVDDESSFEVLKMCIAEIQEIRPDYQEIPIVFAGNKCELPKEQRKVTKELVSNYVHYEVTRLRTKVIECSCKEDINVDAVFRAYLSLAKVSLSSAVSVSLKNRPGSGKSYRPAADEAQIDECNESPTLSRNASAKSRRPSSMKVALGVRKSCDASIITSMKNVSITVTPEEHKNILANQSNTTSSTPRHHHYRTLNNNQSDDNSERHHNHGDADSANELQQNSEVLLERAIRSKLNLIRDSSKPRSRSLIWRPSRRSRTPTSSTSNDQDCRIT